MPRDHARIHTTIWRDREWRGLSRDAQHLYFTIVSQPGLSYCGVMDWWPNRLAALSDSTEEAEVYAAVKELMDAHFIYVDEKTSELLVRTYIKHDGVMQRSNMGKAVGRAMEKVASLDLLDVVFTELAKLYKADPKKQGWAGFSDLYADDFDRIVAQSKEV